MFARADKLFTRLCAARLDNTVGTEIRRLTAIDVLIIDDFALKTVTFVIAKRPASGRGSAPSEVTIFTVQGVPAHRFERTERIPSGVAGSTHRWTRGRVR
ncbi:MAG: ATP-binding protein [Mycobacterium sp.]|nr:ATP-binding protein [Mycobacterium sp.]